MAANDDGSQPATDGSSIREKKHADLSNETKAIIQKFVHKISHEGIHNLRLQYNDLKNFLPPDFSNKASSENPTKCRYKDIVCIDKTRVILKWPPGSTDDFIHANWVTSDLFDNKFICTQAPKEITVVDFWRLVWQEKVKQILMLCRCEEAGREKCAQYWPPNVDETKQLPIGLSIRCTKIDRSDENFVHTRLLLTYDKEKRFVDHRQWTTWPDKSVPQTPLSPFRLLQFTRKHVKYPSLIHCSAGVGRTGTMVAIEMIYKSLINGIMPDPPALLKQLRSQRHLAVQTEDQYIYCHYSIIQLAFAKNWCSRHDVKMFCKEYKEYAKLVLDNGCRPPQLNVTKPPLDCAPCRKLDQRKREKELEDNNADNNEVNAQRKKAQNTAPQGKKSKKKHEEVRTADPKPIAEALKKATSAERIDKMPCPPKDDVARPVSAKEFSKKKKPKKPATVMPKNPTLEQLQIKDAKQRKDVPSQSVPTLSTPLAADAGGGLMPVQMPRGGKSLELVGGIVVGAGVSNANSFGSMIPENTLASGQLSQQPQSLRDTQMVQLIPASMDGRMGGGRLGGIPALGGEAAGGGLTSYARFPGQARIGFISNLTETRPSPAGPSGHKPSGFLPLGGQPQLGPQPGGAQQQKNICPPFQQQHSPQKNALQTPPTGNFRAAPAPQTMLQPLQPSPPQSPAQQLRLPPSTPGGGLPK